MFFTGTMLVFTTLIDYVTAFPWLTVADRLPMLPNVTDRYWPSVSPIVKFEGFFKVFKRRKDIIVDRKDKGL